MTELSYFHGGMHLPGKKAQSTKKPSIPAKLPKLLTLPLRQNIGEPAEPIVAVGEQVLKGQMIARATDYVSSPIHASSSGRVIEIDNHQVAHHSGLMAPCITIETDGMEQWQELERPFENYKAAAPHELHKVIRNAGIVGLGGAGYPSDIKLDNQGDKVELLIINGAECEPYITCDEMLMREHPQEIISGALMMQHALGAKRVLIAVENNKADAFNELSIAAEYGNIPIEIVQVPTVYPTGGEKQLITVLTGKEVPYNGLPIDLGIVCQNVGTAYAVYQAIELGRPLISRYMTITGGVARSRNLDVLLGTPVCDLIEECGGNLSTLDRVIMGGPMMGFTLHNDHVPVIKTTNCLLVASVVADVPLPSRDIEMPCIRCGACMDSCPMNLLPQQLFWHAKAKEFDRLQEYNLFDCIECGCCDYVCPSHIPLVQYYRFAKGEVWGQERERRKADLARQRHEFKQLRQEKEKAAKAERMRIKKAALAATKSDPEMDAKKATIQAALERAKKKKEASKIAPKNIDNLTAEQQQAIQEVDARRTATTQNNDSTDKAE